MLGKRNSWDKLIQDVEDLNKEIGNIVYVLIMDDMMLGSTRKIDINEHLASHKTLVPEIISTKSMSKRKAIENIELIHGAVLNPLELPVELPKDLENYDIWLIKTDKSIHLLGAIEYETYDDIKEITDDIEMSLEEDALLQIEDFAIVIGNSVDLIVQVDTETRLINSIRDLA